MKSLSEKFFKTIKRNTVKNNIKKKYIYVCIILLLSLQLWEKRFVFANTNNQQVPENFKMVANNGFLELYIDENTTEIVVLDKHTEIIWYSNPQDREQDSIATPTRKQQLGTQLAIDYLKEQAYKSMNNLNNSVNYKNFEIEEIENGIKVTYTMTLKEPDKYTDFPFAIPAERFKQMISDKIKDEQDRIEIQTWYKFRSYNDLSKSEKEALSKKYPLIKEMDLYIVDDKIPDFIKETLIEIMDRIGYDTQERMKDIEFYQKSLERLGSKDQQKEGNIEENFTVSINYKLDSFDLIAEIDMNEIYCNDENSRITSISFLRFFGASGIDNSGYIFVPDGCGALIDFNNGKTNYEPIRLKVYGDDKAITNLQKGLKSQPVCLPVFGMKNENGAFLAIIEEGSENSFIIADVSGRNDLYNYVHAEFVITETDEQPWANYIVSTEKSYSGKLRIRYCFATSRDATYNDMATLFRNYLIERRILPDKLEAREQIPLYLELLGCIKKNKSILGIPYKASIPLTTFEQAELIVEELENSGVKNIKLKYNGWFNGGIRHSNPDKIDIEGVLGGKKGFRDLIEFLNMKNHELYLDVLFTELSEEMTAFAPKSKIARYIYQEIIINYPYAINSNIKDFTKNYNYILKPGYSKELVSKFVEKLGSYTGVTGISLSKFVVLNSDFNKRNVCLRHETANMRIKSMSSIKDKGYKTMVNNGSYFTMTQTNNIVNLPLVSSNFSLIDRDVPFYQMVIHGYIPYAGEYANMTQEYDKLLLKSIETGAYPYFVMMYAQDEVLQGTDYTNYYSTNYKNWIAEAADFYSKANEVLSNVQNKVIIKHEIVKNGLYVTTYENGYKVIVNYNDEQEELFGKIIPPHNYAVVK